MKEDIKIPTQKLAVKMLPDGSASLNVPGSGPHLDVQPEAWHDFIKEVKAGKYDPPQKKEPAPG